MDELKLFMVLLGCKPSGRHTEQHDVYFGIGKQLFDLIPNIKSFWKNSGPIHIDGYRIIEQVDGFDIRVLDNSTDRINISPEEKLFLSTSVDTSKMNLKNFIIKWSLLQRTKP